MATMIDTLQFADRFEEAGFEHKQARALASAFSLTHDAAHDELFAKPYLDTRLTEFEGRLGKQIGESEARLLKTINDLGQNLRKDQSEMDVRLTKQIGEVGNNVQARLWTAAVLIGGVAAAATAAVNIAFRSPAG